MNYLGIKLNGSHQNPIVQIDDDKVAMLVIERYHKKSKILNPYRPYLDAKDFFNYMEDVKLGRGPLPAIVLIDINMPKMNGFDVLRKVTEDKFFRENLLCAMLTTSEHQNDKDLAFNLGASYFLLKPNSGKQYFNFFKHLKE